MKGKNIFIIPFLNKKDNSSNEMILLSSLAAGAAIGFFLFKEYISKSPRKKAVEKSGEITDKRVKGRKSAENLLGDTKHRHDPSKINVPEAGTLNWKKNQDKPIFPPVTEPKH